MKPPIHKNSPVVVPLRNNLLHLAFQLGELEGRLVQEDREAGSSGHREFWVLRGRIGRTLRALQSMGVEAKIVCFLCRELIRNRVGIEGDKVSDPD
jgi:hypothetical protein